jgi:SAM-dependent methyltransferase
LIWLDPAPDPRDIVELYRNYFTHTDGSSEPEPSPARLARQFAELRALIESDRVNTDSSAVARVLDVGCGDGKLIRFLLSLGIEAEGMDFDPQAVAAARSRGLSVTCGTLDEQSYPAACFDAVTMDNSIEHLLDPLATLREIVRILKPNGRLIVATPNADSLGHRLFGQSWFHLDPPRHVYIFDCRTLPSIVAKAGFAKVSVSTSARWALDSLVASVSIRRVGRFVGIGVRHPLYILALGRAFAAFEAGAIRFARTFGEQLFLIASKQPA